MPSSVLRQLELNIRRLRQVQQQIEAVRRDFLVEEHEHRLPPEVTQLHLRRELRQVERHLIDAVRAAFGEESGQFEEVAESGGLGGSPRSFNEQSRLLERLLFDLEQQRLQLLVHAERRSIAGIDLATDLFTAPLLERSVHQEVAWSQRSGTPFALVLLTVADWPDLKRQYPPETITDVIISLACVLKTTLRGYDVPCRLEEAEFAVVLREADAVGAANVAHRLSTNFTASVAALPLQRPPALTMSIGVYPFDAETALDLIATVRRRRDGQPT
ncbi:GGDEF domain-containing protein [Candidatus Nitrospira bockiana]